MTNPRPRAAAHCPHPSSLPMLRSLNPELSVYHSLLQQGSFIFLSSPLSEWMGGLLGRIQPGQRPTQLAQSPLPAWGQRSTPRTGGWDTWSPHCCLAVLIFGHSWESLSTNDAPGCPGRATQPRLEETWAENGFSMWPSWIPACSQATGTASTC